MPVAVKPKRKHFTITLEYQQFIPPFGNVIREWADTSSNKNSEWGYEDTLCDAKIARVSKLLFGDTPRRTKGNKLTIKFIKSKDGELAITPEHFLTFRDKPVNVVFVPGWLANRLRKKLGTDKDGNVRFYVEVETEWTKDR